jgi:Uma2 family endonuclease
MVLQLDRKRFTVTDYQHMMETGILQEGEPYELINGEIIRKMDYQSYPFPNLNQALDMGIGKRHASSTKRLNGVFSKRLQDRAIIGVQDPVQLNEYNEPQPDISILKLNPDFYLSGHPKADDIYLLVEVADTTLESDRTFKLPVYAEAGIAEVWIVNLQDDCIEVYRNPSGTVYQSMQTFIKGQTLTIELLPGVSIEANEILG